MRIYHFARKKRQLSYLVTDWENNKNSNQKRSRELIEKVKILVFELKTYLPKGELKKALGSLAFLLGLTVGTPVISQSFSTPIDNPFGILGVESIAYPTFADLDNDGDLDMLIGDYNYDNEEFVGAFRYYENIGSVNAPNYASPVTNPFNLAPNAEYIFPVFVDLDNDGDFDLIAGEYYGVISFFENTGSAVSPNFASPITQPFGITLSNFESTILPKMADIDNDGDFDLIFGTFTYDGAYNYTPSIVFQLNVGTADSPMFSEPLINPYGIDFGITEEFPFPTVGDIDLDGDFDIITGSYQGDFKLFENIGTNSSPSFAAFQSNPFSLQPLASFSFPQFVDIDGDGDQDIMAGTYEGMAFYENGPVGIGEINDTELIQFYPNPTLGIMNIISDERIQSVTVYDQLGKECESAINTNLTLNVSHLSAGAYNAVIHLENGKRFSKKFSKY